MTTQRQHDTRRQPPGRASPGRALRPGAPSSRAGRRAGTSSGLYDTDLDDDSRPRFYLLTMYPYPSGALHIGHWYIKTPTDAIAPLPADARRQRVPADRVRRLRAAGRERRDQERHQPARLDDGEHRARCARQLRTMGASFDWDSRGRDLRPRVLQLEPVAVPAVPGGGPRLPRRLARSTGAPTTARSRASRSRARTATAGAAARRSRSASSPQWYLRTTNYADELLDFTGIDWPEPDPAHADELDRALERARRSCSRPRPRRTTRAARSCACSRPAPTRCSARRSWSSPRSTRWSTS